MTRRTGVVNDKMQRGYRPSGWRAGRNFDPEFRLDPTPTEMLRLGALGGKQPEDLRRQIRSLGFAFWLNPPYMPHGETAERAMNKQVEAARPRLVGINHVALEVGDVDAALAFYGRIFAFTLRGRGKGQAFIDIGDQFLALMQTNVPHRDRGRHFGLVVDDRSEVRRLAEEAGAEMLPGPFLDFLDPWGNRIEVVEYADIQFSKTPQVLRAMGLDLPKSPKALKELADKGVTP